MTTAAIAIGRNEGERLVACLKSLEGAVETIVYVDSGSTDGSIQNAEALGAKTVSLDLSVPFTAARARNAGLDFLQSVGSKVDRIQFLDGDCVLQPDWLGKANAFLDAQPEVAIVCGRRRERFPEASIYNRLIDDEWDTPVGQALACGGDALMRRAALEAVGGFDPTLIAGEEPELCVRLRNQGWKVWRLDAEMTLHDADLTRLGQCWQRSKRAGFAYAQGYAMHGGPPEFHKAAELRRSLAWGVFLPLLTVLGVLISPWALLFLAIWPAQVLRLMLRGEPPARAIFHTLSKLAEGQGALTYYLRRLKGSQQRLIEYK